jgi:hypothetical protein
MSSLFGIRRRVKIEAVRIGLNEKHRMNLLGWNNARLRLKNNHNNKHLQHPDEDECEDD